MSLVGRARCPHSRSIYKSKRKILGQVEVVGLTLRSFGAAGIVLGGDGRISVRRSFGSRRGTLGFVLEAGISFDGCWCSGVEVEWLWGRIVVEAEASLFLGPGSCVDAGRF